MGGGGGEGRGKRRVCSNTFYLMFWWIDLHDHLEHWTRVAELHCSCFSETSRSVMRRSWKNWRRGMKWSRTRMPSWLRHRNWKMRNSKPSKRWFSVCLGFCLSASDPPPHSPPHSPPPTPPPPLPPPLYFSFCFIVLGQWIWCRTRKPFQFQMSVCTF